MVVYADSSFLVSLYVGDSNTVIARDYLARNFGALYLNSFSRSETEHALRLLAFRKLIKSDEMTRCLLAFEDDQAKGLYQFRPVGAEELFKMGARLSNRHALQVGVRYLDMLHIASAQLANAKRFLTFDLRQRKFADSLGLDVQI